MWPATQGSGDALPRAYCRYISAAVIVGQAGAARGTKVGSTIERCGPRARSWDSRYRIESLFARGLYEQQVRYRIAARSIRAMRVEKLEEWRLAGRSLSTEAEGMQMYVGADGDQWRV